MMLLLKPRTNPTIFPRTLDKMDKTDKMDKMEKMDKISGQHLMEYPPRTEN